MLTGRKSAGADAFFADLRRREFGRLDATGEAYLDYTGSALYARSQIEAHRRMLERGVFGNPHAEHRASRASTTVIDAARSQLLRFLDAEPDDYAVCFTANATMAIKLVAESYAFGPDAGCILSVDNHNSINGLREFARRAGGWTEYLPLRANLELDDPTAHLTAAARRGGGLFAFPAQSNFSGVRHPLGLVSDAQRLGFDVLLDAAAYLPGHSLSLRRHPADFVVLSFYKLFGYPTGVGALVARRAALARLRRPWFSGGTVSYASVQHASHQLLANESAFEDGTPSFLEIGGLGPGFGLLDEVRMPRLSIHVRTLTRHLLDGLRALVHRSGVPVAQVYGPETMDCRGGTVTFNVFTPTGQPVPFAAVESHAREARVSVRGGCFCNPGASEMAFGFLVADTARCLDAVGSQFTVERLAACLGPDVAVGAVRASVGLANNFADIDRLLNLVAAYQQ